MEVRCCKVRCDRGTVRPMVSAQWASSGAEGWTRPTPPSRARSWTSPIPLRANVRVLSVTTLMLTKTALAVDLTARNVQDAVKAKGLPWSTAKGFDTFCPVGYVYSSFPTILNASFT